MATITNFTIYSGDSFNMPLTLTGNDGVTAVNLTGATDVVVLFKRVQGDPDQVAYITKKVSTSTVTIVNAILGEITVGLVPADTAGVSAQLQLQYAAKAFFSSTNEVTGAAGLLTIQADIVRGT